MASVTLLSLTLNAAKEAQAQLVEMFGDNISLKSYIIEELDSENPVKDDLIVITSHYIYELALKFIDKSSDVVLANRTLNLDKISKLFEIPEKSCVLVVNKLYDTAVEAIDQLKGIGINHIEFYPYYPGSTDWRSECKYAITFGEKQLVPGEGYSIVDLGIRPIDITTCIEIAVKLNIYEIVKHTLTSVFLKPSVQLLYHFSNEYNKNIFLSDNLQQTLDLFKSGIALINDKSEIIFFNQKAKQLLAIKNGWSPAILSIMEDRASKGEDFFININGRNCHVEVKESDFSRGFGTTIIIEDIQTIEKIEKNYRFSLSERGLVADYSFENIFHKSKSMETLILKAQQFALSDSTVLIEGESGTGKELFAQALHNASPRSKEAFVAVNFAAINENLFESELFGYEEGAFTGAKKGGKKGLFALAHKGTIFLDEIGDAPLSIQKKVLRVIQERQILPVGGSQVIPVDIRIIAATNRNLQEMVDEGRFRQDLFYRLSVLPISIPSLRERRQDIVPLFLDMLDSNFGIPIDNISENLSEKLEGYDWPGNIRELRNLAEYTSNFYNLKINWEEELLSILSNKTRKSENAKHDEMRTLVSDLENELEIDILYNVLKILVSSDERWTRNLILLELSNSGIKISESHLKKALASLKKYDIIKSKTREGTSIKYKGRVVLEYIENDLKIKLS